MNELTMIGYQLSDSNGEQLCFRASDYMSVPKAGDGTVSPEVECHE
jgi:hypothetical protein